MSAAPPPGWHAWLLVVPVASVLYDLLANAAFRRWMQEPETPSGQPPEAVTFFRPLKRGVPRLREKLEMLLRASLPGDQVLFGVDPDSEEETIGEAVRRAFPDRDVAVVRCAPDRAVNPKISKLVQMVPQARHASWLLSDSEVNFSPDFLAAFRDDWAAKDCAALTAAYRFENATSWPQRCDALALLLGLWPGLALVRRYGRVDFTLGACTLFRRDTLTAIGGWQAFGDELAEDHQLGVSLTKAGGKVRLSQYVATLDSDPLSWRDYWRHQRRVAVTYRAANPAGFAGMLLTYGPMWSAACLLIFPREPFFLAALFFTLTSRSWTMQQTAGALRTSIPGWAVSFSMVSVVEALCWILSWFTARVWWGGRRWKVGFRGKLSPATLPVQPRRN